MCDGKSFIYMTNSNGPKIEPLCTLLKDTKVSESAPFMKFSRYSIYVKFTEKHGMMVKIKCLIHVGIQHVNLIVRVKFIRQM